MISLINHSELYARINLLINDELCLKEYTSMFPAYLLNYIKSFSCYNKFAVFILFKTTLRFSDCSNLDFHLITKQKFFVIKQKKTNVFLQRDFFLFNRSLYDLILSIPDFSFLFNYLQLKNEFKRMNRLFFRNESLNFKNKTHLFRHLNASMFTYNGISSLDIKNLLGHLSIDSQKSYIHDEFNKFFSQ